MSQIPPRVPVDRWERVTAAAARVGIAPSVLRSTISAGRADIRVATLGKRGLVYCAAVDVDSYARRIASIT